MDLENQKVKDLTENTVQKIRPHIGGAEAESAGLAAERLQLERPYFCRSPLAGVPLGLKVYHAVEPEFKESVNADVYDEQIGMMEMVLEVDEIISEVKGMRDEHYKILTMDFV